MAGLEEKLAGLKAAFEGGGLDEEEYEEAVAMVRSEAMAREEEEEEAQPGGWPGA